MLIPTIYSAHQVRSAFVDINMLLQIIFAMSVDLKTGHGSKLGQLRKEGRLNTNIRVFHS